MRGERSQAARLQAVSQPAGTHSIDDEARPFKFVRYRPASVETCIARVCMLCEFCGFCAFCFRKRRNPPQKNPLARSAGGSPAPPSVRPSLPCFCTQITVHISRTKPPPWFIWRARYDLLVHFCFFKALCFCLLFPAASLSLVPLP